MIFFSNKYQLPWKIRFNSNVNGLFGQVLSILCVCLWGCYICTEDQNHEPCWQPAASAARNKTRNKCFMKQTYTSLPYFLVTSLLPAAESNHFTFCTFSFNSTHIVISISDLPSDWSHRTISTCDSGLRRRCRICLVNHVNSSQKKKKTK